MAFIAGRLGTVITAPGRDSHGMGYRSFCFVLQPPTRVCALYSVLPDGVALLSFWDAILVWMSKDMDGHGWSSTVMDGNGQS